MFDIEEFRIEAHPVQPLYTPRAYVRERKTRAVFAIEGSQTDKHEDLEKFQDGVRLMAQAPELLLALKYAVSILKSIPNEGSIDGGNLLEHLQDNILGEDIDWGWLASVLFNADKSTLEKDGRGGGQ